MAEISREIIDLQKVVPGGQTLGLLADGRKIFVWGGLPDEKVEVEIYKSKKSYAEGNVTRVITPSSERIDPRDECYLATSPWQIYQFKYENQLKNQLLVESFRQEGIELDLPPIVTDGRDFGYRNKMEYSLWYDQEKQKIFLAFHKRSSHQKIPIAQSSIEQPEVFREAQSIIDKLNDSGDEARKYQSILVRANQQGQVSSALFENGKPRPKMRSLNDRLLGKEFSYSPNGFFQINLPVYEKALQQIKSNMDGTLDTIDLYGGVGSIGLTVANNSTIIESNKFAADEAQLNAQTLQETRAKIICANAEESLNYITKDINLIVDPPRAGLDPRVVEHILSVLPRRVIYLSCNPSTQARDIARLLQKYRMISAQAYNFFPRTPHIESLIALEARS